MAVNNPQVLLKEYTQVNAHGAAMEASPHRLVQMLMKGALDKIAAAKGHMLRNEVREKGNQIGVAISILDALRASLDMERGGGLAERLAALYEYMQMRLLQANLRNDTEGLDEVARLLGEVKSGWDALGQAAEPDRAVGA